MTVSLISNPPYNLAWEPPPFAEMEPRFAACELPPKNNANLAFVLTALDRVTGCAVILLPSGALGAGNEAETAIRKYLVEKNYLDAVIACPESMFESTSIPTCLLVLNRAKTTTRITFLDMGTSHGTEARKQTGQHGRAGHLKREYTKVVNVFRDEDIERALAAISSRHDEAGFSRSVLPETVSKMNYNLSPARYIEAKEEAAKHREFSAIVADINRIVAEKNAVKVTVNETLARQLGLVEVAEAKNAANGSNRAINPTLESLGCRIEDASYISLSKNKNEFSFSNQSKEFVSSILMMIFQTWKHHLYFLNEEENRYLVELRDALLPDLMSGKIKAADLPNAERSNT